MAADMNDGVRRFIPNGVKMARPTRFERVTFAFGGQRPMMTKLTAGSLEATHLQHAPGKLLFFHGRKRFPKP
jgi:hypothetical protein